VSTIGAVRVGWRLRLRPSVWLDAVSAVCWLGLALGWTAARPGGHHAAADLGSTWSALGRWMLMVGAMMLPVVAPTAQAIGLRGLRHRRHQSVAAFSVGYLAVWSLVGSALILVIRFSGAAGAGPVVLCLLAAAAWHCAAPRRAAVRQCRRLPTLALTGARAHVDRLAAGALAGGTSIWTCGLAMTAMCFAHGPALVVGVAGLLLAENRPGPNPEERIGSAMQAAWLVMLAGLIALAAGTDLEIIRQ
jgi:hypothetical protein